MSSPSYYRIGSAHADLQARQPLTSYLLLNESSMPHQILTDMTERLVRAIQTGSGRRGLEKIGQGWAQEHYPQASPRDDAREFQLLLRSTMADREQWPKLMVEFLLSPDHLAVSVRDVPYNQTATAFSLPEQVFLLNGMVSGPTPLHH